MEKLKPEYLTPYLPYSLKVMMEGKKTNVAWMSTKNIAVIIPNGIGDYKKIPWKYAHLNIKPILHPLSRLTSGMLAYYNYKSRKKLEEDIRHELISRLYWEDLVRQHYDVFGLIEKGLAIEKQPLKEAETILKKTNKG